MPDHEREAESREAETEAEIEHQAAHEGVDPVTSREALEEDLMEQGRSEEGEHIP